MVQVYEFRFLFSFLLHEKLNIKLVHMRKIIIKLKISFPQNLRINLTATKSKKIEKYLFRPRELVKLA